MDRAGGDADALGGVAGLAHRVVAGAEGAPPVRGGAGLRTAAVGVGWPAGGWGWGRTMMMTLTSLLIWHWRSTSMRSRFIPAVNPFSRLRTRGGAAVSWPRSVNQ